MLYIHIQDISRCGNTIITLNNINGLCANPFFDYYFNSLNKYKEISVHTFYLFLKSHKFLPIQNKFNGSVTFCNILVDSDNDRKEAEKHKL